MAYADLRADVEGVSVEPERTEDEILRRLYRGLRERRSPQDVAIDLMRLRAERWLSAVGARDLYGLMRRERARRAAQGAGGVVDGPAGSSMSTVWRRHPGLARAYVAATAAMTVVAAVVEVPVPVADPADPASLRV